MVTDGLPTRGPGVVIRQKKQPLPLSLSQDETKNNFTFLCPYFFVQEQSNPKYEEYKNMKSEYSPRLLYPDILAGRSLIRVATLSSCNKKNQKKSITFCFLKYCALQNRDIIYSPIRVSSGCGPLPARDRLSPCCAVSKPRTWFRCFRRP